MNDLVYFLIEVKYNKRMVKGVRPTIRGLTPPTLSNGGRLKESYT
jgi:hypothetical protein